MGMIADVRWVCPGCGSTQIAQIYNEQGGPSDVPINRVPANTGLKWAPPCDVCGEYKLCEPEFVVYEPRRVLK